MKTSDFDYPLPTKLIAQTPIEPRDSSRLMVLHRANGSIEHRNFTNILEYLQAGDVLVFNNSRVIPARLKGIKIGSGGKVEILLLRRAGDNAWEALVQPGKRVKTGARLIIKNHAHEVIAEVNDTGEEDIKTIAFSDDKVLAELGEIPLPPYIHAKLANPERYQTVYARNSGSVAAPTAGLHFTPELLNAIENRGVTCLFVTLHVGLDTFRPVREENPLNHHIFREYGIVTPDVATQLSQAKAEGRRVICVGTTSVRIVEQAAQASAVSPLQPFEGWVSLFILPGYRFRVMDALITNFHLPKSTLLMLVSAFAGRDFILRAYETAVAEKYRFYSFGDAMLVL